MKADSKTTSAKSAKDIASEAAAAGKASQAIHGIDVWCCAAAVGEDGDADVTTKNCSTLQVTSRAIADSLMEASELDSGSADLMFGAHLVGIVEGALWNVSTCEDDRPPSRKALIGTMQMARDKVSAYLTTTQEVTTEEVANG